MEVQNNTGKEIRVRKVLGKILGLGLVGLAVMFSLATFLMGAAYAPLIIAAGFLPFLIDSAIFRKFDAKISMLSRVRFIFHILFISLRTFAYFLMGFLFLGGEALHEITILGNLGYVVIIATLFLSVLFFDIEIIFTKSKTTLVALLCTTFAISTLIIWVALAPGRLLPIVQTPKEKMATFAYDSWSSPVAYSEIRDADGKYTIDVTQKTYSRTLIHANTGDYVVFFDTQTQIVGSGIIDTYSGPKNQQTGDSTAKVSFLRTFNPGELLVAQFTKKGSPYDSSPNHWRRDATGEVIKNFFIVRDLQNDAIQDEAARARSSEIILKNILTVTPNDIVIGNKDAKIKVFHYFSLYDIQPTRRNLIEEGLLNKYQDTALIIRPILRERNDGDVLYASYEHCAYRLGNFMELAKKFYGRTTITETELIKALLDQHIDKFELSTCVNNIKQDKSFFPQQYFYGGTYITLNGELPKNATTSLEIKEQLVKFLNFNDKIPNLAY